MDEDDWASDGADGDGLGDISAIPEVKLPEPSEPPKPEQPEAVPNPPNAWTSSTKSDDVRASLARAHPHPSTSAGLRRDSSDSQQFSTSSGTQVHTPNRSRIRSNSHGGVALFVSNFPYDTSQDQIVDFFHHSGMPPVGVRVIRHQEKLRGAVITLGPDVSTERALSLQGSSFGGRSLFVRLDDDRDNRRRNHNNHQDRGPMDRSSNLSSQSGFGRRDESSRFSRHSSRGPGPNLRNGRPNAVDRGSAQQSSQAQSASEHLQTTNTSLTLNQTNSQDRRDRPVNFRDGRSFSRKQNLPDDPTIPTGPIPTGRKKLELKPRTKPLPVLEVDQRLIDGPVTAAIEQPSALKQNSAPENSGSNPPLLSSLENDRAADNGAENKASSANPSPPEHPASDERLTTEDVPTRRPASERHVSERPSEQPPFLHERSSSGHERPARTRGNSKNGHRHYQSSDHRPPRRNRPGKQGGDEAGVWKSAKDGLTSRAPVAKTPEKAGEEKKQLKSVNPFAALGDDGDDDNSDF